MSAETPTHWFAAKRYGVGWSLPVTWQGWATLFIYFALLVAGLLFVGPSLARGMARLVDRGRPGNGWRMAARNIGRSSRRAAATAMALMRWEPRLRLTRVQFYRGAEPSSVTLELEGTRVDTNESLNLQVPLRFGASA